MAKESNSMNLSKTALTKMKKEQLLELALQSKIAVVESDSKNSIIEAILSKQLQATAQKEVAKTTESPVVKTPERRKPAARAKIETPEMEIEKAKYDTPDQTSSPEEIEHSQVNFQASANNYVVALVQNPYWAFAYWNITEDARKEAEQYIGKQFQSADLNLRIYNLTASEQDHRQVYFDIPVHAEASSWYINIPRPQHTYSIEIGYRMRHRFYIIARSNPIFVPSASVSPTVHDTAAVPEMSFFPPDTQFAPAPPHAISKEETEKILVLTGGYQTEVNLSSAKLQENLLKDISSQVSSQVSSQASLTAAIAHYSDNLESDDFWYHLDCEVIIKGQVKPGGRVFINENQELSLDNEQKFQIRMPLPDGIVEVKTLAVSADKKYSKIIRPIIFRKTDNF